jgi:hypothetical protein
VQSNIKKGKMVRGALSFNPFDKKVCSCPHIEMNKFWDGYEASPPRNIIDERHTEVALQKKLSHNDDTSEVLTLLLQSTCGNDRITIQDELLHLQELVE